MGIEKVIGNRWKAMTAEEKEKHIDKARVEQARLIARWHSATGTVVDDRRSKRRTRRVIPCPSVDVDDRRKRLGCRSVNLRRRTDKGTPSPGWRVPVFWTCTTSIRVIITITITTLTKIAIRSVTTITTI